MASMPGQLSGPRTARAVLWIVETGFKHFYFGVFFYFLVGGIVIYIVSTHWKKYQLFYFN